MTEDEKELYVTVEWLRNLMNDTHVYEYYYQLATDLIGNQRAARRDAHLQGSAEFAAARWS